MRRFAGLNLIDDRRSPPCCANMEQIEGLCQHRPHEGRANTYTLLPRSFNEVRARLFEMAQNDKDRMKSARNLLGQIEVWRLEYGRPNGEPRSLEVERPEIFKAVQDLKTDKVPFVNLPEQKGQHQHAVTEEVMKEVQWLRPEQAAEIEFVERTPHRRLRHASFRRLLPRSGEK